MGSTGLSLKWLEVFQLVAELGSAHAAAKQSGLSVSTVSHHLRSLDDHLGVDLLDRSHRPMRLTPAGTVFLKSVNEALGVLRKAQAELASDKLRDIQSLSLALIDDIDSEISPELAVFLAANMPNCHFTHRTCASHEILQLLRSRKIDLGLANRPGNDVADLPETPFLRDPFVMALPINSKVTAEELLTGSNSLAFLRYSRSQIISGQIEAQLNRLKISLNEQFEIESNQTMMAMIASNSGWAITTPLSYMRAKRFHAKIRLHPFPGKGFARYISLFSTAECSEHAQSMVLQALENLFLKRAIEPAITAMPWLEGKFRLESTD